MTKKKTLGEFQQGQNEHTEELDERTVIMEFEGAAVVEQFVSLTGATALELAERLNHGDEVALEITGKVQKGEIVTRQRERRDGGREETVIIRKIKVDGCKLLRATSQML